LPSCEVNGFLFEISSNINGNSSNIHPTLIWDKDTVILVDAGFPGQLPQLRQAVEKAGAEFGSKLFLLPATRSDTFACT
jgi:hypothetical protein